MPLTLERLVTAHRACFHHQPPACLHPLLHAQAAGRRQEPSATSETITIAAFGRTSRRKRSHEDVAPSFLHQTLRAVEEDLARLLSSAAEGTFMLSQYVVHRDPIHHQHGQTPGG